MKIFTLSLSLLFFFLIQNADAQRFNGNLEDPDDTGSPQGWDLTYHRRNLYDVKLDSNVKVQGKYSVSISSNEKMGNGAIVYTIPGTFQGKQVTLIGHLKTENIHEGYAGLWMRVNGAKEKELAFETMEKQALKGTNGWKEYMITLPYREQEAVSLEA
ncbi:hypothetical protein [Pedobacter sp. JY14-1]|uniref:hypothetical protein n=1 Tax=Pedobacter sp. JY14-1 TaxID=3034151 RepID=UPI0023E2ED97|nr:hypothetical protein [Pedobacter sp. JY14-1]